jgi:hypothetical protein
MQPWVWAVSNGQSKQSKKVKTEVLACALGRRCRQTAQEPFRWPLGCVVLHGHSLQNLFLKPYSAVCTVDSKALLVVEGSIGPEFRCRLQQFLLRATLAQCPQQTVCDNTRASDAAQLPAKIPSLPHTRRTTLGVVLPHRRRSAVWPSHS